MNEWPPNPIVLNDVLVLFLLFILQFRIKLWFRLVVHCVSIYEFAQPPDLTRSNWITIIIVCEYMF